MPSWANNTNIRVIPLWSPLSLVDGVGASQAAPKLPDWYWEDLVLFISTVHRLYCTSIDEQPLVRPAEKLHGTFHRYRAYRQ